MKAPRASIFPSFRRLVAPESTVGRTFVAPVASRMHRPLFPPNGAGTAVAGLQIRILGSQRSDAHQDPFRRCRRSRLNVGRRQRHASPTPAGRQSSQLTLCSGARRALPHPSPWPGAFLPTDNLRRSSGAHSRRGSNVETRPCLHAGPDPTGRRARPGLGDSVTATWS